jgi:hypothetical protein
MNAVPDKVRTNRAAKCRRMRKDILTSEGNQEGDNQIIICMMTNSKRFLFLQPAFLREIPGFSSGAGIVSVHFLIRRNLRQTRHIEHGPALGIPAISTSRFSGPGVESTPS